MAIISCVIPTYREESYIPNALESLSKQTVFDQCEIIIADYDPENTGITYRAVQQSGFDNNKVKFVKVNERGIGLARHEGIMASTGYYIVSFDADAEFHEPTAIEKLVAPLADKSAAMTHCKNLMNPKEVIDENSKKAYESFEIRSLAAKIACFSFEPGLTITRFVYDTVGGFPDVKACEGTLLGIKCAVNFGIDKVKFIPDATVYVSGRRHTNDALFGFIPDIDYYHAYRSGQKIDVV